MSWIEEVGGYTTLLPAICHFPSSPVLEQWQGKKETKGKKTTSRGTPKQCAQESRLCHTPSTVDWSPSGPVYPGHTRPLSTGEAVEGECSHYLVSFARHHQSFSLWTESLLSCGPDLRGSIRSTSPLLQLPKTREMTQTQSDETRHGGIQVSGLPKHPCGGSRLASVVVIETLVSWLFSYFYFYFYFFSCANRRPTAV